MDLLLSNKVAVVTGASRGIGKASSETLSAEGMKLVLVPRSREEMEALARSLSNETLVGELLKIDPTGTNVNDLLFLFAF